MLQAVLAGSLRRSIVMGVASVVISAFLFAASVKSAEPEPTATTSTGGEEVQKVDSADVPRAAKTSPTESPRPANSPDDVAPVELFEAMRTEQVSVRVIPSDSRRLTLIVENHTNRPLRLETPPALAAMPVLAQPGLNGGLFGNLPGGGGAGANNGASQALGLPGGGNQGFGIGGPGQFGQGNGGNIGNPGGGFFKIPAGKTIKRRVPCVCLEFGKPDPRPQIPYTIAPIESATSDPRAAAVVTSLGDENTDQRVAQLAAWHFANDKSWDELAALKLSSVTRIHTPRFSVSEIRSAQKLADFAERIAVPFPRGASSASDSLSYREQ